MFVERKHNLTMPRIVPTKKLFHEWKGKPYLIKDIGRLPTDGRIAPTNNDGGKPFNGGGKRHWGGDGGGSPWSDNSCPSGSGSNGPQKTKIQYHTLWDQQDRG